MSTVFEGCKIWISRKTPKRSFYTGLVHDHGGQIVATEKDADILISNPSGDDPNMPSEAVSFTYLTDSIKHGILPDLPDYRINRDGDGRRPPPKATRTPFSVEDDRILCEYVENAQTQGLKTAGNELYITLAKQYPHHTWQSWRSRYTKELERRKRAPVKELITSERRLSTVTSANTHLPVLTKSAHIRASAGPSSREIPDSKISPEHGMGHPQSRFAADPGDTPLLESLLSASDFHSLLEGSATISSSSRSAYRLGWTKYAAESGSSVSAQQYREFYEKLVEPVYDLIFSNKSKRRIYTKYWEDWCKEDFQNKEKPASEWLYIYQNTVLKSFDPSPVEKNSAATIRLGSPFKSQTPPVKQLVPERPVEVEKPATPVQNPHKRQRPSVKFQATPSKRVRTVWDGEINNSAFKPPSPGVVATKTEQNPNPSTRLNLPHEYLDDEDDDDVIGTPIHPPAAFEPRRAYTDPRRARLTQAAESSLSSHRRARAIFSSPLKRAARLSSLSSIDLAISNSHLLDNGKNSTSPLFCVQELKHSHDGTRSPSPLIYLPNQQLLSEAENSLVDNNPAPETVEDSISDPNLEMVEDSVSDSDMEKMEDSGSEPDHETIEDTPSDLDRVIIEGSTRDHNEEPLEDSASDAIDLVVEYDGIFKDKNSVTRALPSSPPNFQVASHNRPKTHRLAPQPRSSSSLSLSSSSRHADDFLSNDSPSPRSKFYASVSPVQVYQSPDKLAKLSRKRSVRVEPRGKKVQQVEVEAPNDLPVMLGSPFSPGRPTKNSKRLVKDCAAGESRALPRAKEPVRIAHVSSSPSLPPPSRSSHQKTPQKTAQKPGQRQPQTPVQQLPQKVVRTPVQKPGQKPGQKPVQKPVQNLSQGLVRMPVQQLPQKLPQQHKPAQERARKPTETVPPYSHRPHITHSTAAPAAPPSLLDRVKTLMQQYGCSEMQAFLSIFSTNGDFSLDGIVVKQLLLTNEIPADHAHIWTTLEDTELKEISQYAATRSSGPIEGKGQKRYSDDEAFEMVWRPNQDGVFEYPLPADLRATRVRLVKKHGATGPGGCEGRLEFLKYTRQLMT